jgi:multidrug efflux system outer membrane protein
LGGQSSQLSNLFSGAGNAWNFAPQMTTPIFNAGRIKSNVRGSEAQRQLALAQYQQSIRPGFREVSDALVEYRKVKSTKLCAWSGGNRKSKLC